MIEGMQYCQQGAVDALHQIVAKILERSLRRVGRRAVRFAGPGRQGLERSAQVGNLFFQPANQHLPACCFAAAPDALARMQSAKFSKKVGNSRIKRPYSIGNLADIFSLSHRFKIVRKHLQYTVLLEMRKVKRRFGVDQ